MQEMMEDPEAVWLRDGVSYCVRPPAVRGIPAPYNTATRECAVVMSAASLRLVPATAATARAAMFTAPWCILRGPPRATVDGGCCVDMASGGEVRFATADQNVGSALHKLLRCFLQQHGVAQPTVDAGATSMRHDAIAARLDAVATGMAGRRASFVSPPRLASAEARVEPDRDAELPAAATPYEQHLVRQLHRQRVTERLLLEQAEDRMLDAATGRRHIEER
jgi:hypothetical protein